MEALFERDVRPKEVSYFRKILSNMHETGEGGRNYLSQREELIGKQR